MSTENTFYEAQPLIDRGWVECPECGSDAVDVVPEAAPL